MSMQDAYTYAQQSTCLKRQVGCVIVKDSQIIAYGFNHGYHESCGCSFKHKNPHVLHAEAMALQGTDDLYLQSDLYVTYQPCLDCAKLIQQKNIRAVYYAQASDCTQGIQYLNHFNISTYSNKEDPMTVEDFNEALHEFEQAVRADEMKGAYPVRDQDEIEQDLVVAERELINTFIQASNPSYIHPEQQYLKLLDKLLQVPARNNRTGIPTHNTFSHQMRFDLSKGFPLLTTKKVHFHAILVELLWFLKGDTNIKYLLENNVHIWTDWRYKQYVQEQAQRNPHASPLSMQEFEHLILSDQAIADAYGNIGKGYGHQWRNFGEQRSEYDEDYGQVTKEGFDQIAWVINEIKTNPDSRRLIVTGWNPHEVNQVDLPPCHTLFQFYVQNGKLSCQLYQRSADTFLGLPFNIASYALLTHIIAKECGLTVGEFIWTGGDVHLYTNHTEQAQLQLSRIPYTFPSIKLNYADKALTDLTLSDFELVGYESHPAIKAPIAV